MNLWRIEGPRRPKVLGLRNILIALSLHIGAFLVFYTYSVVKDWLKPVPPEVMPIDLTVVVVENLNGVENEPPPLKKPEPPPPPPPQPKPKPKPKPEVKEPEKPKELEQIVTNVVKKVEKKKEEKKPEPKKEEKKPEPKKEEKKPEPPKKTKEELRRERIKRMQESATDTKQRPSANPAPPQPNGRTARKTLSDAEIRKLLGEGYRAGTSEQIASSELQRCYSLIKMALKSKWNTPAWNDRLRPMQLKCVFGAGGRLVSYSLVQGSGDPEADRSILEAASRVKVVRGLTPAFINSISGGIIVEFEVKSK